MKKYNIVFQAALKTFHVQTRLYQALRADQQNNETNNK